jgi:hypothetical protein
MSWWTSDKQAYAVNYLTGRGLSPWGAAALVSRWTNVESAGGPSSVNRYSGAFGIAQWLGARKIPIAGNTNFDAQLGYVVAELNGSESRAGALLRSAVDAYSGAVGASAYERAEGYNSSTGIDNFTSRTASGVAAVLSAAQTAGYAVSNANDSYGFGSELNFGFGSGELILAAAGVLVLLVVLDI